MASVNRLLIRVIKEMADRGRRYLPVSNRFLPLRQFLEAFHFAFSFVNEHRCFLHHFERLLETRVVRVFEVRVLEKLLQLERIFTDLLNWGQEKSLQRNLDHLLQQTTRLKTNNNKDNDGQIVSSQLNHSTEQATC